MVHKVKYFFSVIAKKHFDNIFISPRAAERRRKFRFEKVFLLEKIVILLLFYFRNMSRSYFLITNTFLNIFWRMLSTKPDIFSYASSSFFDGAIYDFVCIRTLYVIFKASCLIASRIVLTRFYATNKYVNLLAGDDFRN